MGQSKSKTGIGFVDNAVNYTVNEVVSPAAKNVEAGGQRLAQGLGSIAKGDLNNAGNTLLEVGAMGMTGGTSLLAGYKAGETPVERKQRETLAKIAEENAAQTAADAAAAESKRQSDINNIVGEVVASRRRQPGKAATLLTTVGAASSYGPLLTANGGR